MSETYYRRRAWRALVEAVALCATFVAITLPAALLAQAGGWVSVATSLVVLILAVACLIVAAGCTGYAQVMFWKADRALIAAETTAR